MAAGAITSFNIVAGCYADPGNRGAGCDETIAISVVRFVAQNAVGWGGHGG
jgi:hypothetical protein